MDFWHKTLATLSMKGVACTSCFFTRPSDGSGDPGASTWMIKKKHIQKLASTKKCFNNYFKFQVSRCFFLMFLLVHLWLFPLNLQVTSPPPVGLAFIPPMLGSSRRAHSPRVIQVSRSPSPAPLAEFWGAQPTEIIGVAFSFKGA